MRLAQAPDTGKLPTEKAAHPGHGAACLNCGAPLTGPFCAACGQRDIPPYPSTRELVVDAFTELSGWDGRLASTVRALVRRPGMLTREFLEGRRARYISPLRLYLMFSLVYFVLAAGSPEVRLGSGETVAVGLHVSGNAQPSAPASRPERVANAAGQALESGRALTPAERDSVLAEIARAPALMQPFLRRAVVDPAGFKRGILETMPRMLFALLPVFAGIVALFFRGRKYPEHLYFAIHLHAFIFLALAAIELVKYTRSAGAVLVASAVALPSIPIYATVAFRRVYGDSLVRTLVKEAAIAAIYCVAAAVAFTLLIYWVSIAA
jgi:hypothetical protein